jgi:5-formyltetrahydrofolate cyclo-ligase
MTINANTFTTRDPMTDGHHLRKTILAARDRLTEAEIAARSEAIAHRLLALPELESSGTICIYVSFRSEVRTLPLIRTLLAREKRVVVPLTRIKEKRLDLISLSDPDQDLVPGYCNIPEPRRELLPQRLVEPEQLDLVVLPGSVFDERGGRFGYGGGYYDRLLAGIPRATRVALAFEMQMVGSLPLAEHDQLLDRIVTEKRVIHGTRQPR